MAASSSDASSSINESPLSPSSTPQCIGFGSNFFQNLGSDHRTLQPPSPSYLLSPAPNTSIQSIHCGATHTTILTTTGQMYTVGTLHGRVDPKLTLRATHLPLKVTQIAHGRRHVLALVENGSCVVSWGAGHFGQLGHGPNVVCLGTPKVIERLLPRSVGGPVIHIAAGGLHSAAIIQLDQHTTKTFAWGSNRKNQCGVQTGPCNTLPHPQPVETSASFRSLSLGRLHSLGLNHDGKVYSWGSTEHGRCGYGSSSSSSSFSLPKPIETLRQIIQIATGDRHNLALNEHHQVYSWGYNADGQLGLGHTLHFLQPKPLKQLPPKIIFVSAAGNSSSAISQSGELYTWGYNDVGQLGHALEHHDTLPYVEPFQNCYSIVCSKSFDSHCNVLQPKRVESFRDRNVQKVSMGPIHTIVLTGPRLDGGRLSIDGTSSKVVVENERYASNVNLQMIEMEDTKQQQQQQQLQQSKKKKSTGSSQVKMNMAKKVLNALGGGGRK